MLDVRSQRGPTHGQWLHCVIGCSAAYPNPLGGASPPKLCRASLSAAPPKMQAGSSTRTSAPLNFRRDTRSFLFSMSWILKYCSIESQLNRARPIQLASMRRRSRRGEKLVRELLEELAAEVHRKHVPELVFRIGHRDEL